jgi:peptidyl-tRNA hydrolase
MKHVCIINQSLKMSKGKIARVTLHLGFRSNFIVNPDILVEWENLGTIGVVLKVEEKELLEIREQLRRDNISFVMHIDSGLTQVDPNSLCGISFFADKNKEDIFGDLKLL